MTRWKSVRLPAAVLTVMALAVVLAQLFPKRLVINRTGSVPLGLYWLSKDSPIERGRIVTFPIPPEVRDFVLERRLVPKGGFFETFSKPVAALAGDRVCIRDSALWINDAQFAPVPGTDSAGRSLPTYAICRALQEGEVFVATSVHSFDSRYYGPIRSSDIVGTLSPLMTW